MLMTLSKVVDIAARVSGANWDPRRNASPVSMLYILVSRSRT